MRDVLPELERWQAAGKPIAIATVISVVGSAPRGIGATLALTAAGDIAGSVSGGCVEPAVIEEGLQAIRTGQPEAAATMASPRSRMSSRSASRAAARSRCFVERLANLEPLATALNAGQPIVRAVVISAPQGIDVQSEASPAGSLSGETGGESRQRRARYDAVAAKARELLQGWRVRAATIVVDEKPVEVFFDVYLPEPTLVVIGAGHITIPLTRLAKMLGYHVTVVDPREAFATRERLPDADDILLDWPDDALAHMHAFERHRRRGADPRRQIRRARPHSGAQIRRLATSARLAAVAPANAATGDCARQASPTSRSRISTAPSASISARARLKRSRSPFWRRSSPRGVARREQG